MTALEGRRQIERPAERESGRRRIIAKRPRDGKESEKSFKKLMKRVGEERAKQKEEKRITGARISFW